MKPKVSKLSEEQLFYLMSRGISEERSDRNDCYGIHHAFTKELPMNMWLK